jgi:hypothetical protein
MSRPRKSSKGKVIKISVSITPEALKKLPKKGRSAFVDRLLLRKG